MERWKARQPAAAPSATPTYRPSNLASFPPVRAQSWLRTCPLSSGKALDRSARALRFLCVDRIKITFPIMPDAKAKIALELNDEPVEVAFAPHKTLLEVLREDLVLGLACAGHRVKTVEGMAEGGRLHPLQDAFAELGAAQCGYCTPAFLLAADALLVADAHPSRDTIKQALSGNLCRCTGYLKIYEAVELAAARMRGEKAEPAPETLYGRR